MPFEVKCYKLPRQVKYKVFFEYHPEIIERIKNLENDYRKWDGVEKCWTIHTKGLFELIKSYRNSDKIIFLFPDENGKRIFIEQIKKIEKEEFEKEETIKLLAEKKEKWVKLKDNLDRNFEDYREITHKNLKDGINLYPHQIAATIFINEVRNVLLAMDMGTGKSITSIAYVEMNDFKRVLVITPNSLKFNYYNEVIKFTNSKAHIVNWKKNKFTIEESKYVIVNYEYFNSSDSNRAKEKFEDLKIGSIKNLNIDVIISDECQKLKNTSSNMYRNFKKFFGNFKKSKVFMSGTPMNNRVYELYTILNQISPIDFPTKKYFYEYYCGMKYDLYGFGWDFVDVIKFDELYEKIKPFVFRKRKDDVLSDLPDKIFETIHLELTNSEMGIYKNIENDTIETIFGSYQEGKNRLTILLELRQYLSSIKFNKIKETIDNVIDNNEKIVIIDVFKDSLNKIKEIYGDLAVLHTGDFSVEERSVMVNKFQNENSGVKIFLGSFSTSSVGLTLTSASKMFILTLPFSIGEYNQVTDRIHRIGQKKSVNIYPVIINDTIDDYIFNMLDSKLYETTRIMDNVEVKMDYNKLDIDGLFKSLLNKRK